MEITLWCAIGNTARGYNEIVIKFVTRLFNARVALMKGTSGWRNIDIYQLKIKTLVKKAKNFLIVSNYLIARNTTRTHLDRY